MGNASLSTEFKSGKWKSVQTIGNREVLRNIQSQIQVQKHYAMSDFKSFDDRFKNTELYNWRKSLPDSTNIVKLYDYEIKQERFGIQQDQYVYTEKIHRLNKKAIIFSKPQAFLLILDLLTGLDILFQTFGLFNVDVFLLGLSQAGRGKVWVNQNYAKNTIDESNAIESQKKTSEFVVVNNLVHLIRDKVCNQTFMPQIQFPFNMYLKDAVQYLKAIRKDHPLFRVDKVYLNRNFFNQYYDELYKQHIASIQPINQPNQNFINLPKNLLSPKASPNIQKLPNQQQPRQLERQKSVSFMKIKNEPSQTLSSQSNSRSKKPKNNILPLGELPNQEIHPFQHGKIHLKDITEKQRISASVNEGQKISNNQFEQIQSSFDIGQKISNPINQAFFQQRPMIPNLPMKNINNLPQFHQMMQHKVQENRAPQFNSRPIITNLPMSNLNRTPQFHQMMQPKVQDNRVPQFNLRPMIPNLPMNNINNGPQFQEMMEPKVEENREPQFNQRPSIPINQIPQHLKGRQVIQRKIIEYRPLNIEERQNIQQLLGPQVNNNQRFMPFQNFSMPQNLRPAVQQVTRQNYHPPSQTLPLNVMNRPLQQENINSQKMGLYNVPPRNFNQINAQEEQFINNVELCQSVIFDRGQVQQNMTDF